MTKYFLIPLGLQVILSLKDEKMFNLLKKLFHGISRYSLTISKTHYHNGDLICLISDKTNVNPYQVFAKEIFSNDNLLSQIKPRELLKLKEIYDSGKEAYVMLTESYSSNKFKILYHDHEFVMTGKDICKDINLLKSMRFNDAFRIIYNTAYTEAMLNYTKLMTFEIKQEVTEKHENTYNNVISMIKNDSKKH